MERLMHRKSDLLVWDLDNQSDDKVPDVIYWSSYTSSESDGIFSIPQLVEQNSDHSFSPFAIPQITQSSDSKLGSKADGECSIRQAS